MTQEFFEKLIWSCMLAIAAWAATQLQQLNTGIHDLNVKIAVIVEKVKIHDDEIREIKSTLKGAKNENK